MMIAAGLAATAGLAIAAGPDPIGFLPTGYVDLMDVVPPAPIPQEPRGVADRAIFKLTRALKGSRRWDMAVGDVATDTPAMMRDFSCAARIDMTPANAPKTAALLERASSDSGAQTNELKLFYKRKRPFLVDPGETCEAQTDALINSFDYPSGHATRGWTWALILAELVDDRAAPILARGRAYGDSRVVCGVHNMSAVEAGRMVASSTMAVVRSETAYQDAVVVARHELEALRKSGTVPSAQACSAEEVLTSQPIYR
jgi:acid phosphatase (class A)